MKGSVVFLSAEDLSEQRRIPIGEGTVVRVLWHSKINQVSHTSARLCAMLMIGVRYIINWSCSCPILAALINPRCSTPTKEDAENSTTRSIVFHRRSQTSHLHPRCSSSVRRPGSPRIITSKRQASQETQAYRTDTWSWKRWSTGSKCYSRSGPGYIHEGENQRGCKCSPGWSERRNGANVPSLGRRYSGSPTKRTTKKRRDDRQCSL